MRSLGALLLLLWACTFAFSALRRWRRPAGFLILCIVLGTGAVGLLKETTNVDCPRSLAEFGGSSRMCSLFAERPAALPHARCFPRRTFILGLCAVRPLLPVPAAQSASGACALALALTVGGLFAFGQEARGAHFLSHDIWSAAIVWFACLGVFASAIGAKSGRPGGVRVQSIW